MTSITTKPAATTGEKRLLLGTLAICILLAAVITGLTFSGIPPEAVLEDEPRTSLLREIMFIGDIRRFAILLIVLAVVAATAVISYFHRVGTDWRTWLWSIAAAVPGIPIAVLAAKDLWDTALVVLSVCVSLLAGYSLNAIRVGLSERPARPKQPRYVAVLISVGCLSLAAAAAALSIGLTAA